MSLERSRAIIELQKPNSTPNYIRFKVAAILILIIGLFFFVSYYPTPTDVYDYWHILVLIKTDRLGHINTEYYPNVGYYVLTLIVSQIAEIPYDIITSLPLQAVPLIFLLLAIISNITKNDSHYLLFSLSISIAYLTRFDGQNSLGWWCHGIGWILFLTMLFAAYIRIDNKNEGWPVSLVLILCIISINFISYTMTFLALAMLFFLEIFQKKMNSWIIILIGFINVLAFNHFLYGHFIPIVRISSELESSIRTFFGAPHNSILKEYRFNIPSDIRYLNDIWYLFISIVIFVLVLILFIELIQRQSWSNEECIFLSLFLATSLRILVYAIVGTFYILPLVPCGIFGLVILYTKRKNKLIHTTFIISIIFIFILINLHNTIRLNDICYYEGMNEYNYNEYMYGPCNWYINRIINNNNQIHNPPASDVFTAGYFAKEFAKENLTSAWDPKLFSANHAYYILEYNDSNFSRLTLDDDPIILNYNLNRVWGERWISLRSWRYSTNRIKWNPYLDEIYYSGHISIFLRSGASKLRE